MSAAPRLGYPRVRRAARRLLWATGLIVGAALTVTWRSPDLAAQVLHRLDPDRFVPPPPQIASAPASEAPVEPKAPETSAPSPEPQKIDADTVVRSVFTVETDHGMGMGFTAVRPGVVVTNAHVVGDVRIGAEVTVRWGYIREPAVVRAISSPLDLAVLECKPTSQCATRPPLPLGEGASLKLGATVFAFGNPAGLDLTMTKGILSHRGRKISRVVYMQTDLAVNPGNSGGPLLDEQGRVVGVVTAKLASAEGIAFALPIEYAVSGIEAPLRAMLEPPLRTTSHTGSLAELIRTAPNLAPPNKRSRPGARPTPADKAATTSITMVYAYAGGGRYALQWRLVVPNGVGPNDSKFRLRVQGVDVELGRVEAVGEVRRSAPAETTYTFEYVGIVVGGNPIWPGRKAVLFFGDRYRSAPFAFVAPSFNIRLK